MTGDSVLPDAVTASWQPVVDEATELASEYEDDGWEAVVVHPGDVTAVFGEDFGLDVLAPGEEFATVSELVEDADFDRSHVYKDTGGDVAFFLTAFEATADEVVVVVPTYVRQDDHDRLVDQARAEDVVPIHVRPLSDDERVTFTVEDVDLFAEE